MKTQNNLGRLKQLQTEADRIRRKLRITTPNTVLYLADLDECDDRRVVVEADGFGGATASIVEGNYPIDYLSHYAKHFDREQAACDAVAEIVEQNAEPEAILV